MLVRRLLAILPITFLATLVSCGPDTSDCRVLKICAAPTGGAGGTGGATSVGGAGTGGLPADLGNPCSDGSECSTSQCVDGVCCESACGGTCLSCAASGSEGTCAPIEPGTDPDNECSSGVCDGVDSCASGEHVWSKRFGATYADGATSVSRGPGDDLALTGGYTTSGPDFGGGTLPSAIYGAFAVQLDVQGNHNWSKRIAESTYANFAGDESPANSTNASGTIAIAGRTDDFADFGAGQLDTNGFSREIFVGTLQSNGSPQALLVFQDTNSFASDVAWIDSSHVTLAGHVDSITIGSQTHPAASFGNPSLLLAKFDGNTPAWSKSYPGTAIAPVALVTDSSGNIYAAGTFDGSIAITPPLTSPAKRIFVIKLDSDGNVLWGRAYGAATTELHTMATDAMGNVYLGGSFTATTDFGGATLTTAGGEDAFVAALDPDGEHRWSKRYGSSNNQGVRALDTSTSHLLLAGTFAGGIDLGGGNLSDESAFVAKLTLAGDHVWSHALTGPVTPRDLATTSDEGCVVVGSFSGNADLGGTVLTASGSSDAFVARFAP